jgi:mercuric ion transport protein
MTSVGAMTAAVGSALCCVGPLVAVALGVSGAGLSSTFEPLRPYFLGATGLFLFGGFFLLDREEKKACDPTKACADVTVRRRMKTLLWIATIVAAIAATYPTWSAWIL